MNVEPEHPGIPPLNTLYRPEMAFPSLTEEMICRLRGYGLVQSLPANTILWTRGQREVDMFVVLEGKIELYARDLDEEHVSVSTLEQRQFTGELDLLSSRETLIDGCTAADCVLLRIDRGDLKRIMRAEGDIANLIMQAAIWRRLGIVESSGAGILLIGRSDSPETIRLHRFLTRNTYPHRMVEPSAAPSTAASSGEALVEHLLPAVMLTDGILLHKPTIAELADRLGINEVLLPDAIFDLTIVGAGPAGLATAVYGASEGLSTLVLEGVAPGGQAGTSSKIENYLGFPTGVSGQELANRAWAQAQKFGAHLVVARQVVGVKREGPFYGLTLEGGSTVCSRSIVIATGAEYRKLAVDDYVRFEGQGIQYAATAMEAMMCRNQEVAVIGGGNSAGQAAVFLSGIVRHLHLIIRRESLAATMSSYLIARIEGSSHITLHTETEVSCVGGNVVLERIRLLNVRTGQEETLRIGNMFVMIGAEPNTGWLYGTVALDKKGFVITGDANSFENTRYATNAQGIYAVGDVRSDSVKRVASSVGEGSVVVSDIHRYLSSQRDLVPDAGSTLAALQKVEDPQTVAR